MSLLILFFYSVSDKSAIIEGPQSITYLIPMYNDNSVYMNHNKSPLPGMAFTSKCHYCRLMSFGRHVSDLPIDLSTARPPVLVFLICASLACILLII